KSVTTLMLVLRQRVRWRMKLPAHSLLQARRRILNIGCESSSDTDEGVVDILRESVHTRNCSKRDQSNDQSVLNEILALFAGEQIAEFGRQQQKILHFGFSKH